MDIFGVIPKFLENLLESENLFCSAKARMKSTPGILQLRSNHLVESFFKVFGTHSEEVYGGKRPGS